MKHEIVYILTADVCIIEEVTKKITLAGIFTGVTIPNGLPGTPPMNFVVFARVKNLEGVVSVNVRLLNPDNSILTSLDIKGNLGTKKDANLRAGLNGVVFTQPGEHKILFSINGKELEHNPDHIIKVKNE